MAQPGNYVNAVAVTTADTGTQGPYAAFMITGAGNIKVRLVGGQDLTLTAATVNTIYPFKVDRVYTTGTTATGIIGLT